MRKKMWWFFGFIILSFVMVSVGGIVGNFDFYRKDISAVSVTREQKPITVVIDAGHGGEDGGCVAADGTLEKDLNLAVALDVYEMLRAAGVSVALTRSGDGMVYDMYSDLDDYEGVKKTYDLKNRVRFAKESECLLFVSIHMNKFSDERFSGLQVYFSPNDSDSITAALRVQSYVTDYLQPDNEREIKRAGSNIYVLHRSQMPAVLIECGFLSNPEERERLKDREYQKKLSFCIAAAVVDSLANFQT
ncbi:MAG: hypothetical protein E7647_01455 [Ruminococcaceae bacterium]|nr:hypothetical protein [Oscillospiraceae bacterium]